MPTLRVSDDAAPTPARGGRILALVILAGLGAGWFCLPPAAARAQDAPASVAANDAAQAGDTDASAPSEGNNGETPPDAATAGDAAGETSDGDSERAAAETPAGEQPAGEAADVGAAPAAAATNWAPALVTLAAIALPILLGNWLARSMRMPDYAWKFATIFTTLTVATLACLTGEFKGGPDLAGGITLVYEIARDQAEPARGLAEESAPEGAADPGDPADGKERVNVAQMIDALKQRIDPAGTKEVTIRRYGDAIEIIIPHASGDDLAYIKRRITDLGQLEFRITADPRYSEDRDIIEKAESLGPSQKLVMINGTPRAEWVTFEAKEFPPGDPRIVRRKAGPREEALVLLDRYNVTGEYLTLAAKGSDDVAKPAVDFVFNASGARRFGKLTGDNLPNAATGAFRNLGILLDKKLLSAPRINSRITDRGQISGGAMDEREVEYVVSVLNAGSLPAALNKEPISEETISPTLGATTIEMGKWSMIWSLVGVLAFMLLYYRFAGVIACLALAGTMVLILGAMVVLQAAFTLPGLAGLVLTVGMAVDANVLIYERIREELKKGASLRTAIRNGFERATTTIVDSNLTTLLTGFVLYAVGTDQIRGFAVTIVLGILMSMFTAVFCSRVALEVAERKRWVKTLRFGSLLGETNLDFLALRWPAILGSLALILLGLGAAFARGRDMFNIDFTGGTSVTFALRDDAATPIADVREALESTPLGDKNLLVVERGDSNTRFTVSTSVEDVDQVKEILEDAFPDKLLGYSLETGEPKPFDEAGGFSGTELPLVFNEGPGYAAEDGLAHDTLLDRVTRVLAERGAKGIAPLLENPEYTPGSSQRFKNWTLKLATPADEAVAVAGDLAASLAKEPLFPLANKIGGQVASDLAEKAIYATIVSVLGIIAYLWFRFQNVNFGLAAVIAVMHDVLVTVGALALSAWVVSAAPPLAQALQLERFQISLSIVAALITVIGYSLNDTIVIFDRIREVRGKSPRISYEMVNRSINQTLSRTLLTSLTTLIVVVILYFFGGPGIHGFAFSLVVGVTVGTYSTIYIATPLLLWLTGWRGDGAASGSPTRAAA